MKRVSTRSTQGDDGGRSQDPAATRLRDADQRPVGGACEDSDNADSPPRPSEADGLPEDEEDLSRFMDPDPPFPLKVLSKEEEKTFRDLSRVKHIEVSDEVARFLKENFKGLAKTIGEHLQQRKELRLDILVRRLLSSQSIVRYRVGAVPIGQTTIRQQFNLPQRNFILARLDSP